MSKAIIDGLRHAYEAYCRGDIQGAVDSIDFDPNVVWIEPKEFSAGGTYQGRQGVIDYLTRAYAANEQVQNVPEEIIEVGDKIAVFLHFQAWPKGGGQPREGHLADVYTVHSGKVVQMQAYADPTEARKAIERPGQPFHSMKRLTTRRDNMDEMLSVLGTPEMIAALETNLEEKMMSFGRGLAGGEIYHDGEIEGFFTGHAHLNGVLRTHLKKLEGEYIQSKITAVKHYFREKQVKTIDWSLGQDCQPANMALYLERQGFQKLPEENTGMALDITTMPGEEEAVKDLEIREIEDLEELKVLRQLEVQGFGSSFEMAQHYYEMYANLGFGRGTAWRHFSGWQQAKAVALTSLLLHAGLAGIYGVTTVPEVRRRGIARAMVLHAIHEARQVGYRIAILSPTEMSEGIYRQLGFRAYTQILHYTCSLSSG